MPRNAMSVLALGGAGLDFLLLFHQGKSKFYNAAIAPLAHNLILAGTARLPYHEKLEVKKIYWNVILRLNPAFVLEVGNEAEV